MILTNATKAKQPHEVEPKTTGLTITSLALPGMASAREDKNATAEKSQEPSLPSAFHVKGTQTIRTEVTPDEVIRHVQKRSPSLKTRYGLKDPVFKDTERIERQNPEEDGLPHRKTYTETRPWNTYYAKEDEWAALYNNDAKAVASVIPNSPSWLVKLPLKKTTHTGSTNTIR